MSGDRWRSPRAARLAAPEHAPDSPNRPLFPSTVLRPGDLFESTTVFRFSDARRA